MRIIITVLIVFFSANLSFAQTNNQKPSDAGKPFVLGVIDEIQSAKLAENRILNIYLPEGYDKNVNFIRR